LFARHRADAEHWFILVYVEIEANAARILDASATVQAARRSGHARTPRKNSHSLLEEAVAKIRANP
jgi:hypothetical protein